MILFLTACGFLDSGDKIETTTLTDVGTVCLNESGEIQVNFPGCLSSSCDTLTSATCTATLDGDLLVVHAEAVIESQGETCTDDCGFIVATCEMPLIEDPTGVSFSYAGTTTALDAACDTM